MKKSSDEQSTISKPPKGALSEGRTKRLVATQGVATKSCEKSRSTKKTCIAITSINGLINE